MLEEGYWRGHGPKMVGSAIEEEKEGEDEGGEEDEEKEKKGKEDFRRITCCMCWHECPLL
jgi:hypothetical protein